MISEKEYASRRSILAKKLSPNSVSVLYSAEEKSRSNDTEYPYRQNSNFYYMCGFKEANISIALGKQSGIIVLDFDETDPEIIKRLWNEDRLTLDHIGYGHLKNVGELSLEFE